MQFVLSVKVTLTVCHNNYPPVTINGTRVQIKTDVKYLDHYLDQRLTWDKHIQTKKGQ